jgi:hypothetical protein
VIAMPLNAANQFTSAGVSFNAPGLASIVGPGVQQILAWDAANGFYLQYIPGAGGDPFNLVVGGVYWLELDSTSGNIVSFVGDVPAPTTVDFDLQRPTSGDCLWNEISIPLDQSSITTPQGLADSITNVEQVLQWDAANQFFLQYIPGSGGDPIPMKIGYPYLVCLQPGSKVVWP